MVASKYTDLRWMKNDMEWNGTYPITSNSFDTVPFATHISGVHTKNDRGKLTYDSS